MPERRRTLRRSRLIAGAVCMLGLAQGLLAATGAGGTLSDGLVAASANVAVGLSVLVAGTVVGRSVVFWPAAVAAVCWVLPTRLPSSPPPPPSDEGRPPIVLVTLDTFRYDHLGAIGGFERAVNTPSLDALAQRGTLFVRGVAPAPLSVPSHATLLTGVEPAHHGALTNRGRITDTGTVAAALQQRGYQTAAFVSSRVVDASTGLDAGFSHYDDVLGWRDALRATGRWPWLEPDGERRGDATVARALEWLRAHPRDSFVWVHLFDPHRPYAPPEPFDTMYATDGHVPGHPDQVRAHKSKVPTWDNLLVPDDLRPHLAAYAGEISWTDHVVGQLVAQLPEDARIVVVADHGESLTEHGIFLSHGHDLHDTSLRVPIIVVGPGYPAGQIVEHAVPLRFVAHTLRGLAGFDEPSLLDPHPSPIWSFSLGETSRVALRQAPAPKVAKRDGAFKWIVEGARVHCYDVLADPDELDDIAWMDPEGSAIVRAEAQAFLDSLEASSATDRGPDSDEALRTLGYID